MHARSSASEACLSRPAGAMSMTSVLVDIDQRRLLRRLDELAQRGAIPGGGVSRVAGSPAHLAALELVSGWMRESSLLVRRDGAGNAWGRVEGSRGGRAIVAGSHIDGVRSGGALDGALGVVAAIEAIASLVARYGRPKRILECVAIGEHEPTRTGAAGLSARAIADRLDPDEAADAKLMGAVRRDIDVFIELHVEQGPALDDAGERLGVVTAIGGLTRCEVTASGAADDAAATAMARRRDALAGASAMIAAIDTLARDTANAVASIAAIEVEPRDPAVVPSLARFAVEVRAADDGVRVELASEIARRCGVIAHERELDVDIRVARERSALTLNERIADVLRRAGRAADVVPRDMVTLAEHDARHLAGAAHTGLLLVPSIGGRSHRPDEATDALDVVVGTRVLATALHDLAYS